MKENIIKPIRLQKISISANLEAECVWAFAVLNIHEITTKDIFDAIIFTTDFLRDLLNKMYEYQQKEVMLASHFVYEDMLPLLEKTKQNLFQ